MFAFYRFYYEVTISIHLYHTSFMSLRNDQRKADPRLIITLSNRLIFVTILNDTLVLTCRSLVETDRERTRCTYDKHPTSISPYSPNRITSIVTRPCILYGDWGEYKIQSVCVCVSVCVSETIRNFKYSKDRTFISLHQS